MEIIPELEDLSELHQEYAKVIGISGMIALSKHFGGTQIYIPKYEELIKFAKYKNLLAEYQKGVPIKTLAKRYDVSESTIYHLIRQRFGGKVLPGQMNILDFLE